MCGHTFHRGRGELHERVEKLLYSEVVYGAPEEDRCLVALEVLAEVERVCRALHKLYVVAELFSLPAEYLVEPLVIKVRYHNAVPLPCLVAGREEVKLFHVEVVNAAETLA